MHVFVLTGQPLLPVGVVSNNRGLSSLEDVDSQLRGQDNRKTRRDTQTLLGTRNNDIQLPFIETDFFGTDRADTINNNQSFRRDGLDGLGDSLNIRQNTGAFKSM